MSAYRLKNKKIYVQLVITRFLEPFSLKVVLSLQGSYAAPLLCGVNKV